MSSTMESSIDTLLDVFEEERNKGEGDLEIYHFLQNLTMDIIFKCALAQETECQKIKSPSVEGLKTTFLHKPRYFVSVPVLLFPYLTKIMGKILFLTGNRNVFLKSSVRNLEKVMKCRRRGEKGNFKDVLSLLLEASEGKHEAELKAKRKLIAEQKGSDSEDSTAGDKKHKALLTDQEIIDNAIFFLLAGYETTSNALGYTLLCLAQHQDVQIKAQEEITRVLGDKKTLNYEDVSEMHYLEQVLMESMRLYPPAVFLMNRTCKQTITINGYTFPKGCEVEAPVYLIHRYPDYWPEPEKFDPERFSAENKKNRHPSATLPFGIGPRKCIGERFAFLEAKFCVVKILQKYNIVLSSKMKLPLDVVVRFLFMNPKDGIWVRLEPRKLMD